MSGNNDLELNLSPIKKQPVSRGRRANNSATKQGFLDDDDDTLIVGSPLQSRPVSGDLFAGEFSGFVFRFELMLLVKLVVWMMMQWNV